MCTYNTLKSKIFDGTNFLLKKERKTMKVVYIWLYSGLYMALSCKKIIFKISLDIMPKFYPSNILVFNVANGNYVNIGLYSYSTGSEFIMAD